jgi:signal transduction histidine kinase
MREREGVNHQTVLIVAQEPAMARDIVARWQAERIVPSFTLMSTEFPRIDGLGEFDLAIIQGENGEAQHWHQAVNAMAHTVLQIGIQGRVNGKSVVVPKNAEWLSTTILIAKEMLRRCELEKRLRKAEASTNTSERQALLGQYMLDTRHGFNNALTSVLGNAELLMASAGKFDAETREQVETIHTMALKLYEMMQRFSSLEAEMRFEEKNNTREFPRAQNAAFGS